MTLVIAGFERDGSIIFCGDSLITQKSNIGSIKLTSSFRKIIPIDIIARVPQFCPEGKITRYVDCTSRYQCMIAFAGSTLVSQHIINNIQGHLKRIKYTFDRGTYSVYEGRNIGAHYKLIMGCEDNEDIEKRYWDDDVFSETFDSNNEILDEKFIVNLFKHCIEKNINDFFLSRNEAFESHWFASDFIAAFTCNRTKKNKLFTFKMKFTDSNVSLDTCKINEGELAIIGISRYTNIINHSYNHQKSSTSIEKILIEELNKSIKDNEEVDLREIGGPVVLKVFDDNREILDRQKVINK